MSANARELRDTGLIPGWGRFPGGGHGNHFNILARESPGERSLVGYSPKGEKTLMLGKIEGRRRRG